MERLERWRLIEKANAGRNSVAGGCAIGEIDQFPPVYPRDVRKSYASSGQLGGQGPCPSSHAGPVANRQPVVFALAAQPCEIDSRDVIFRVISSALKQ